MGIDIMCIVCVMVGCMGLWWCVSYVKLLRMDENNMCIEKGLKRVAFQNAVNTLVLFAVALSYYRAPQSVEPYEGVIMIFVFSSFLMQAIVSHMQGEARASIDIKYRKTGGGV